MFGLGPWELGVIAVILLLLFGANRLPEIGKGLGGALHELKNIKKELKSSPSESEKTDSENPENKEAEPGFIEKKIKNEMLNRVPGVRKAMDINDKINKVKEVIK